MKVLLKLVFRLVSTKGPFTGRAILQTSGLLTFSRFVGSVLATMPPRWAPLYPPVPKQTVIVVFIRFVLVTVSVGHRAMQLKSLSRMEHRVIRLRRTFTVITGRNSVAEIQLVTTCMTRTLSTYSPLII